MLKLFQIAVLDSLTSNRFERYEKTRDKKKQWLKEVRGKNKSTRKVRGRVGKRAKGEKRSRPRRGTRRTKRCTKMREMEEEKEGEMF